MVFISLKKYKIVDLITLFVIGTIIELIFVYLIPNFILSVDGEGNEYMAKWTRPTYCASILVIIIAIVRWNSSGLVLIPFFSLVGFLGAKSFHPGDTTYYSVGAYFASLIGMCGCSVVLLFKRTWYKKGFHKTILGILSLGFSTIVCVVVLQSVSYAIIEGQNVFSSLIFHSINAIFSLAITLVFLAMLKNQEIVVDMVESLHQKALEAKKEKEFYDNLSFDEEQEEIIIRKEKKESNEK